jgi:ATP-dependent Clp protease ATP-binding subunit ClpC
VTDRYLPDKAIDLIDESASRVRMYKSPAARSMQEVTRELRETRDAHTSAMERSEDSPKVTAEDIAEVVSMWTGVPVMQIAQEESERLLQMEDALHERIVGQDEAITAISKAVRRARAGLKDPKRPVGSFVFLGPTGVGKTELTKALAEFLFGSEEALIQIDMSEFMERHSVSRLVGAPPGYVGYDDAGQLTEAIRRRPYSIIVFRHALIVMTSNLGAELIMNQTKLGFATQIDEEVEERLAYEEMHRRLTEQLKKEFRPEFINRVDSVIVFHALTIEQIKAIVDLELAKVARRLEDHNLKLRSTEEARELLATLGYEPEMGARPLRRVIQAKVEDVLSDALLTGEFQDGDTVLVDVADDELFLTHGTPEQEEALAAG